MKVEILYVADCPSRIPAINLVKGVLAEQRRSETVVEIEISDPRQAAAERFLGSPTIRVNGKDVESQLPASGPYGVSCRTYLDHGRRQGLPPREWIQTAVRAAMANGEKTGENVS